MEKQIKFIFWNVHRNKDNISKLLDYSWNNNIDVIIICEEPDAWDRECVLGHYRIVKRIVPDTAAGIEVFIRNDDPAPPHYFRENRRHAMLCLKDWNINLVVAHLNSNMTPNAEAIRTLDIQSMVNDLDRIEEISGSKHSLIVGDLNIGLFDEQMSSIIGLNYRLKGVLPMADNKQHDTRTTRRPDCVTEIRMGNSVLVVSGYFKKDTTTTAADKMARVLEAEAAATQEPTYPA